MRNLMELKIGRDKRGILFTLMAISLLSLFLVSFSVYSLSEERERVVNRIESMNNYVFSFEEDMERKLFISGFRIIFLFEKRMLEEGLYISDVESVFNEAFVNGTIEGTINSDELALIQGVTLSNISDFLSDEAAKVNLNVNLSNPMFNISQTDPWNVRVDLTVDLYIADQGGLAFWNRTASYTAFIPITNFEDPLYIIETNGVIAHKITKTPYELDELVVGGNTTNINDHLNNFYYINSTDAPSFLDRLEGNFSANPNGVESLVNIQILNDKGVNVNDKVVVDHIYFSTANPSGSTPSGMPSWFELDSAHESFYGF